MSTRVLLVDDHEIVRYGLHTLLDKQAGLEVIGQAKDGLEAVELAQRLMPDIIVLDVSMPKMNGIEAARQIRKALPECRILVLSMYDRKHYVLDMLSVGISGYILKINAVQQLMPAIKVAIDGDIYLCPKIAKLITTQCLAEKDREDSSMRACELTGRERQVLQLLAEGKSSKQIGLLLDVGENTVVTHRQNIMKKLDLHSVAALTKYAIQEGITSLYT